MSERNHTLDWTRNGDPIKARFEGECPHPDCPKEGVIEPGELIVRLNTPKSYYIRNVEGTRGYIYDRKVTLGWAHLDCTIEPPEPEPIDPDTLICRHCGASLLKDDFIFFRCPECNQ